MNECVFFFPFGSQWLVVPIVVNPPSCKFNDSSKCVFYAFFGGRFPIDSMEIKCVWVIIAMNERQFG